MKRIPLIEKDGILNRCQRSAANDDWIRKHLLLFRGRKEELEAQLTRARGTDFTNARTDVVSIGTIVQATDLDSNQSETFTILGAWDFDADKGLISYLTPVGQALLNKKVGEEVEFEVHGARHRHRVEKIEAFKQAESTEPPPPSPA